MWSTISKMSYTDAKLIDIAVDRWNCPFSTAVISSIACQDCGITGWYSEFGFGWLNLTVSAGLLCWWAYLTVPHMVCISEIDQFHWWCVLDWTKTSGIPIQLPVWNSQFRRKWWQVKKDQRTSLNLRPTVYRKFSATWAWEGSCLYLSLCWRTY